MFLDNKINSNREKVNTLKAAAENKTSKMNPDKVQTTSSKQKMADAVCSYSDIENIINEDEKKRQEIIDVICLLKPSERIVLYKCYVENMEIKEIPEVLSRSKSWVYKKHTEGVKTIQKILDSWGM